MPPRYPPPLSYPHMGLRPPPYLHHYGQNPSLPYPHPSMSLGAMAASLGARPPINMAMGGGLPGQQLSLADYTARAMAGAKLAPLPLAEKPHTTVYVGKIAGTVEDNILRKILEVSGGGA